METPANNYGYLKNIRNAIRTGADSTKIEVPTSSEAPVVGQTTLSQTVEVAPIVGPSASEIPAVDKDNRAAVSERRSLFGGGNLQLPEAVETAVEDSAFPGDSDTKPPVRLLAGSEDLPQRSVTAVDHNSLPDRRFGGQANLPVRDRGEAVPTGQDYRGNLENTEPETNRKLTSIDGGKKEPVFMSKSEWARVASQAQAPIESAAASAELRYARGEAGAASPEPPKSPISEPLVFEPPQPEQKSNRPTA